MEHAIHFIDAWLTRRLADEKVPGLSVAVYCNELPIWKKAFGTADIEARENLTTGHLFHMASQTKTLTAVACLQLVEAGKLKPKDSVT